MDVRLFPYLALAGVGGATYLLLYRFPYWPVPAVKHQPVVKIEPSKIEEPSWWEVAYSAFMAGTIYLIIVAPVWGYTVLGLFFTWGIWKIIGISEWSPWWEIKWWWLRRQHRKSEVIRKLANEAWSQEQMNRVREAFEKAFPDAKVTVEQIQRGKYESNEKAL